MSDTFGAGYDGEQGAAGSESPADQQEQSQTSTSPAGAQAGESGGQDREGYIPKHRFQEVIEQRRQWEASARQVYEQLQAAQRELAEARRGPQQQPAVDENTKRIREQILEVMPELKQVLELAANADSLKAAAEVAPGVQQLQEQFFNNLGAQAVRTLDGAINATFKGTQVPDGVRRGFHVAFIDYLDQVPDARQRYMSGDMSVAAEWWQQWQKQLLDPYRRSAAVQARESAQRVGRLPKPGAPTQTLGTGGQGKPKTEEELHDAAFEALVGRMAGGG